MPVANHPCAPQPADAPTRHPRPAVPTSVHKALNGIKQATALVLSYRLHKGRLSRLHLCRGHGAARQNTETRRVCATARCAETHSCKRDNAIQGTPSSHGRNRKPSSRSTNRPGYIQMRVEGAEHKRAQDKRTITMSTKEGLAPLPKHHATPTGAAKLEV